MEVLVESEHAWTEHLDHPVIDMPDHFSGIRQKPLLTPDHTAIVYGRRRVVVAGQLEKHGIPETTVLQRINIVIEFLEPPLALPRNGIRLRTSLRCGKQSQVTAYKGYGNTYFFSLLQYFPLISTTIQIFVQFSGQAVKTKGGLTV